MSPPVLAPVHNRPERLLFHCPGCNWLHVVNTAGDRPVWTWNGDLVKPTFSPSLLYWIAVHPEEPETFPEQRCHSFIRDGKIQFLDDCTHKLKGQTVPIPPWEEEESA